MGALTSVDLWEDSGTGEIEVSDPVIAQRLRQARRLESLGRLAGGVAHDFNNMLSVILNYASFLREEIGATDPKQHDVDEIIKAGERAAHLTRQLLTFSRRDPPVRRAVSLNHIVQDLEALFRRTIGEDIEVGCNLDPELWNAFLDVGQVEQVLTNLVFNARDAMPQGGMLLLNTRNQFIETDSPDVERLGLEPGAYVVLEVVDTGTGMAPDVASHVFEPFFTTKEPGRGTGLGLSTAYGIVRQHDGTLTVESEPGEGTIFQVWLAATDHDASTVDDDPPAESIDGGGRCVLVVEDEPSVRSLAVRILRRRNFDVLEAGHISQALILAEQHRGKIEVLLTDIVMPDMSGPQLAERIRQRHPDIEVVYMSGYYDHQVLRTQVGGDDPLVQKPFTSEGLLKVLQKTRQARR